MNKAALLFAVLAISFLRIDVFASDALDKLVVAQDKNTTLVSTAQVAQSFHEGSVCYTDCEINSLVWIPQNIKVVIFVRSTLEKNGKIIFYGTAKPLSGSKLPAPWEIIFERNPGVVYLCEGSEIKGEILNGSIDESKNSQSKL